MATYAIGDVQGCYTSLQHLIQTIGFTAPRDRLWFTGDLVNRGPDSLHVLRYVKSLGSAALTVLGNHDLFLLAVGAGIGALRPNDTLLQVLEASDRNDLLHWLRHRPLLHRDGDCVMVHAGVLPQWTVDDAQQMAWEAEEALRGAHFIETLKALHPNDELQWSPGLAGAIRFAASIKVLTRLRTCSLSGVMESSFSGPPELTPEGFYPWFDIPLRRSADATVIIGHWAAMGLRITKNLLALDSGCVYGRHLTAVRLEDRKVFQVICEDQRARH